MTLSSRSIVLPALTALFLGACAGREPDGAASAPDAPDAAAPQHAGPPGITARPVVAAASLRGVDVWDAATVWVSGSGGTVLKSADGGESWERIVVPDGETLDFRDVEILGESTVLLMSVGNGDASRIYRTEDGGVSWELVLRNAEEKAFFNSLAFWDATTGILVSDSYDGKPYFLKTEDGGRGWRRVGEAGLPPLLEGEYNFAASGTCVAVAGTSHAFMATGGAAARLFASDDGGASWEVFATPIGSGTESAGIFSVALRDARRGVLVGGDYQQPELDRGNAAWTSDGGRTWTPARRPEAMTQKASAVHLGDGRYLAAGRLGVAYSDDDGASWRQISTSSYYAIGYDAASGVGWLVGAEGHMARFE